MKKLKKIKFARRQEARIARHERKRKAVKKWLNRIGYSSVSKANGYKTVQFEGRPVRVHRKSYAMEMYSATKASIRDRVQRTEKVAKIRAHHYDSL